MKVLIKYMLLLVSAVLLLSSCEEEEMPNWERNICSALTAEDYTKFQNLCNDYLEQNENEDLEALLSQFNDFLDDMECVNSRVKCFECLPFEPPASEIEIRFSSIESENITRSLVVISFQEAMFIRVAEIR